MFILSITLRICYNPAFLFDKYLDEYNQAKKHYEEKWGPLTLDSEANKGKVWKWQKGWPFEGMSK